MKCFGPARKFPVNYTHFKGDLRKKEKNAQAAGIVAEKMKGIEEKMPSVKCLKFNKKRNKWHASRSTYSH